MLTFLTEKAKIKERKQKAPDMGAFDFGGEANTLCSRDSNQFLRDSQTCREVTLNPIRHTVADSYKFLALE